MIQPAFEILNQRGTPMFFSDVYANIPTAGIVGRIFIRTDSPYGIYRDTGSAWDQIAGSGGGGGITGSGVAGQVTFWDGTSSVSGSNNLWFDNASGKFLVGTNNTTGAGKLQVTSATGDDQLRVWGATSPSIRIDNAVSGATQRFVMGLATATNNFIQGSAAGDICISTASASPLLFGMWQTTNASEVMRISTANNLLIGTTTDAGYKIDVSGTGRFTGVIYGSSQLLDPTVGTNNGTTLAYNGFSANNNFSTGIAAIRNSSYDMFFQTGAFNGGGYRWYIGTTEVMTITKVANFGFGNSTPIVVSGYNTLSIGGAKLGQVTWMNGVTSVGYAYNDATNMTYGSNAAIIFATGVSATERMRLASTGNLLIGTTTDAGEKLQVNGTAKIDGFKIGGTYGTFSSLFTNSTLGAILQGNSAATTFSITLFGNSGSTGLFVDSQGRIKIGVYTDTFNSSAILDIVSTTRGFLPPRMTTAQINAISTPAEGLVAYNTTLSHLCCYQAGTWVKFSHTPM